jgi:hypothetical protein
MQSEVTNLSSLKMAIVNVLETPASFAVHLFQYLVDSLFFKDVQKAL